jgi:hypothetical protein
MANHGWQNYLTTEHRGELRADAKTFPCFLPLTNLLQNLILYSVLFDSLAPARQC